MKFSKYDLSIYCFFFVIFVLFCLKGVACKVLSSTVTEIKCRTGPSEGEKSIYQGELELLKLNNMGKGFIVCRMVRWVNETNK